MTVTHPEIIRYFMTIPEAAELVLQASALARGGDVFVLDMGTPVEIVELARLMIRLAGRRERSEAHPDGDIEIRFTGLRPGEKLHEELLIGDAEERTEHPMILRAREEELPWSRLSGELEALERACEAGDEARARAVLAATVEGYAVRSVDAG